ncbi:MAG: response regulator [Desulfovibrio sp.]|jgi:putative two-component system response regulator|nr:response regulator [Desulfovibrio sp.]
MIPVENKKTKHTIMVIDDNASELLLLKNILGEMYDLRLCKTASFALSMLERISVDIILLDIEMPDLNGYEVLKIIKANPATKEIPVIFLTGRSDNTSELEGLTLGAVDYLAKPFSPPLLLKHIEIHLLIESQKRKLKDFNENLRGMVAAKTEKVLKLQKSILKTVAALVEYRDTSTGSHIERTERYLEILVTAVMNEEKYKKFSEKWDIDLILQSSLLHDVGKIAISDSILLKPGPLDAKEFAEMKKHVQYGLEFVEKMKEIDGEEDFTEYARIMTGYHHEKWDGTGYPHKLKGEDIPLLGRIMAIADVYDAVTSERPYKKTIPHKEAMAIIRDGRGSHFDPSLVDLFMKKTDEIHDAKKLETRKNIDNKSDGGAAQTPAGKRS